MREMREEKEGFGGGGSGSPPPPMTPRRVSRPKMRAVAVIGQSTFHSWGIERIMRIDEVVSGEVWHACKIKVHERTVRWCITKYEYSASSILG